MTITQKTDWQTKPFPNQTLNIPFERGFSSAEMFEIKIGLLPKAMEDKWFIYYENDTLNFHRSWTGHHIYQINFSQTGNISKVVDVIVNNDSSQYNRQDDNFEIQLINFLIDRLLLNNKVPFPTNENIEVGNQALYRHNVVGAGRSNKEE